MFCWVFDTVASSFSCRAGLASCRPQSPSSCSSDTRCLRFAEPQRVHCETVPPKWLQPPLRCYSVKWGQVNPFQALSKKSGGKRRAALSGCFAHPTAGRAAVGFLHHPLNFEERAVVRTTPGSSVSQRAGSCTESKKKRVGGPASFSSPLQEPCGKVMEMMERLLPAKGSGEAGAQVPVVCQHGCSHRFCGCRDLISEALDVGLVNTENPGELWSWGIAGELGLCAGGLQPARLRRPGMQNPCSSQAVKRSWLLKGERSPPVPLPQGTGQHVAGKHLCCKVIPTAFKRGSEYKLLLFMARTFPRAVSRFP